MRNTESLVGDRAAPKRNEIVGVGSFFTNPQGNALRSDFADVQEAVHKAQATLKAMQDTGRGAEAREFREEHQPLLALAGSIVPIEQRLSALQKQLKLGPASAEKRDAIYAQQLQVMKQVMALRKQAAPWL
jgi:hypothetical protein